MNASEHGVAYLDHAATTPVRSEVLEAMAPFAGTRFGNPSGSHGVARDARRALEEARDELAALLGAQPREVVFTSGGTEAANLAVLGTLGARAAAGRAPGVIVHSAVEHPAVIESCRAAARGAALVAGVPVVERREVPVDATGTVDVGALASLLGPEVSLVSVMLANNEVGTVQPLGEVASVVRRRATDAVLHTDAVQAAATIDLVQAAADADLVSISGHKFGGPKGTGALVVRAPATVAPLLWGGGQEQERRSGTHNVAGSVGLAVALRVAAADRAEEVARLRQMRDRLADGLVASVDGLTESVPRRLALPSHCHVRVEGVEREELLLLLDRNGVCASGGSSCASGALEPSHVLSAMGVDAANAAGALRFTLGYTSTAADVDRALEVVPAAVAALREHRAAERVTTG